MNSCYQDFLSQILLQQPETQDTYDLSQLVSVFGDANIHDIVDDSQLINSFYERLFDLIPFVERGKINIESLSNTTLEETEILKKVIKTISVKLDNLPDDGLEAIRLVASIFLIVRYIKADFNIWFCLGSKKPISNRLAELLITILSSSSLVALTPNDDISIHEQEYFTSYQEGLQEGNLSKIYHFIDALSRGLALNGNYFIEEAVSFLFWADLDILINIFNSKSDLVPIYYLLQGLSIDEKLSVGLKVSNPFAQIECIREIITSFRGELSQNQSDLLSECLIKLSNSHNDFWSKFLSYFNVYPSRYALLQKSLGKALASMPDRCLVEYVDSINIDQFQSNPGLINECLNSFINHSSEDRIKFILNLIFQKWDGFMEIGLNSGFKIFNIFFTGFFDYVVIYLSYQLKESQLIEVIEQVVKQLNSINSKWFDSKNSQTSYFHILLSKLFLYSTAWKHCGYSLFKDSQLANQLQQFTTNKYLFQVQTISEETLNQISTIRNNFDL
jgi:hypothetical protein